MSGNDPDKHHFVPKCYLKRWAGPDKRVCEYQRPYKKVVARRVHPDGTGYKRFLYAVPERPADKINAVETGFLKPVDNDASFCLDIFLVGGQIPDRLRSCWSRFIMRMMQGHPDRLAEFEKKARAAVQSDLTWHQAEWEKVRRPGDPESYREALASLGSDAFSGFGARALPKLSDLKNVGQVLNDLAWTIVRDWGSEEKLLTSDRPVITSNGLQRPDAHVLMPIGPSALFMATAHADTRKNFLDQIVSGEFIPKLNHIVACQAGQFVYGVDDGQLEFVEGRLGNAPS